MSERIDVLAGATIAGAGGDAVRGKGPALTQWVDAAVLSRHLCRFEALTLALWTVQRAICAPAHRPRPALLPAPAAPKEGRAAHPQLHLERRLEASHGRP